MDPVDQTPITVTGNQDRINAPKRDPVLFPIDIPASEHHSGFNRLEYKPSEAIKDRLTRLKWADDPNRTSSTSLAEYLTRPDTRPALLERIDRTQIGEAMSSRCVASVIIPAHNEATHPEGREEQPVNIERLLDGLDNQQFTPNSNLSPDCFEVTVVDNNSSDSTAGIAIKWVENHPESKLKVRVISVNFSDNDRGVGSARKLGGDLAIYRSSQRQVPGEFYILGIDADNFGIDPHYFEETITTFRKSDADVLAGKTHYNPSEVLTKYPHIHGLAEAMGEFADAERKLSSQIPEDENKIYTSGANHAITGNWYVRMGGYAPLVIGEDTFVGEITKILHGKLIRSPTDIELNSRRYLLNIAAPKGDMWEAAEFEKSNDKIRQGEAPKNLDSDMIRDEIARHLDLYAQSAFVDRGQKWTDAVEKTRLVFKKLCQKHDVDPNLFPTDIFYVSTDILDKTLATPDAASPPDDNVQFEIIQTKVFTNEAYFKIKRVRDTDPSEDDSPPQKKRFMVSLNNGGIPIFPHTY